MITWKNLFIIVVLSLGLSGCGGSSDADGAVNSLDSLSYETTADNPVQINLATDSEGVTFEITDLPTSGTLTGELSGNPLSVSYTPQSGFVGDDSLGFKATDIAGSVATGTIAITVTNNIATENVTTDNSGEATDVDSIASSSSQSFASFSAEAVQIALSTDVADVNYIISSQPANGVLTGQLTGNPLLLTYTSNSQFIGDDEVEFSVSAEDGSVATGTITITVMARPDTTVDSTLDVTNNSVTVAASESASYATFTSVPVSLGLSTSVEGMRFAITNQPSNGVLTGSLSGNPLSLTYTSTDGFVGDESIGFSVTDSSGNVAQGTLEIAVLDNPFAAIDDTGPIANSADVAEAESGSYSTFAGSPVLLSLSTAVEGMKFEITSQPANGIITGSLSGNPLALTYTPNAGYTGNESVSYKVTDANGTSATGSMAIAVIAKPEAPVDVAGIAGEASQALSTFSMEPVAFNLSTSVDDVVIQVASQPANGVVTGTLSGNNLSLTYVSNDSYVGTDVVNFTVTDKSGNSAPGTVAITVLDKPVELIDVASIAVAVSGQYSTYSGVATPVALTTSVEGVHFDIPNQPTNGILSGALTGNPLSATYTSNADFVGDESVAFTVAGVNGETASGSITISVIDVIYSGVDSDGDGLTDLDEINVYGTSPTLADTDADGFSDYKEIVTYGFDRTTNNFRFNPLIADLPQIQVNITSQPDIHVNYTHTDGTNETESTSSSNSTTTATSYENARETNHNFEHAHSVGLELGMQVETTAGLLNSSFKTQYSMKVNTNNTFTYANGSSETHTDANSTELSELSESLKATETVDTRSFSNGGIDINVQVENTGHLAYQLNNLYLNASYYDYKQPTDVIVPIGNMAFENSTTNAFPGFTLSPGETTTDLTFTSGDLTYETIQGLLDNSQGLSIRPAIFDMLDENGVSYIFNSTGMSAQNATVSIDYAGYDTAFDKMVATNAKGPQAGVSMAEILTDILQLSVTTDSNNGNITAIESVANSGDTAYWMIVHATNSGNDEYITTTYTTPEDEARMLALNPNISNLVSTYDINSIVVKGGDVIKLFYMLDSDGDGLGDRAEFLYGTDSNLVDTDGDGLSDKQEADGWVVKYTDQYGGAVEEHIYPDPLVTDTDLDGVSDYDEANPLYVNADDNLTPFYRRNPTTNDTDGDNLFDSVDDLDGSGDNAESVFDVLDITRLVATTDYNTGDTTVDVDILDVTEAGAGKAGNSITSYQVHIYRHIAAAGGSHPEPTTGPLDYAPVILGSTLPCGTDCNWTLVHISTDIPGAVTEQFLEDGPDTNTIDRAIQDGESYKYIAYIQINGEYFRSSYSALASKEPEKLKIRLLYGSLTNVLARADDKTFKTSYINDNFFGNALYSAVHDELWVQTNTEDIPTLWTSGFVNWSDTNVPKGNLYTASTGVEKGDTDGRVFQDCAIREKNSSTWYTYECWTKRNVVVNEYIYRDYENFHSGLGSFRKETDGYVEDAVSAIDLPPFSHKLGKGDGHFDLGWELHFDGEPISNNPDTGERVCNSSQSRASGLNNGPIATLPTLSCANADLFGGVEVTRLVPPVAACYELDLLVREYDGEQAANNKVVDPITGRNRANVDRMELCRDDSGIWELNKVQLLGTHDKPQTIHQLATGMDYGTPMVYTTRTMEWKDSEVRSTMDANLAVTIEVEVTSPEL